MITPQTAVQDKALAVSVAHNRIQIGPNLTISFKRTLRVPQDGRRYSLPADLGDFPLFRVDDFADRVPAHWRAHGGVFLPMWRREAAWISFHGSMSNPVALLVGAGKVNAVTGEVWRPGLDASPQNYMVVGGSDGQRWLDGFKCSDGSVRQFVAMSLGEGYTVEAQVTGKEDVGGIQLQAFACRPERCPPPPAPITNVLVLRGAIYPKGPVGTAPVVGTAMGGPTALYAGAGGRAMCSTAPMGSRAEPAAANQGLELGLAAGGLIEQAIKTTQLGPDAFDPAATGRLFVHIVDAAMFKAITGLDAPPTPITPEAYKAAGYPWWSTYDEDAGKDVTPTETMKKILPVAAIDLVKNVPSHESGPKGNELNDPAKAIKITNKVRDGKW